MVLKNICRQDFFSYLDNKVCPPYGRTDLKNIFVKEMKGNDKDFLRALDLLSDLGTAYKKYLSATDYAYPSFQKLVGTGNVKLAYNLRSAFKEAVNHFCFDSHWIGNRPMLRLYTAQLLFSFVRAMPRYFAEEDIETLINFYCHE